MKNPKAQPKTKPKKTQPRAVRGKSTRISHLGGVAPAFVRLPPNPIPLSECVSINHPRGKDGGWGH